MTKLEELINELCPDGVEYKTVGEVCTIKKGAQLNKDKLKDNGLYPVINGGVNPSGYWDEYNFNANLITISQGGASAGYVNFMTTPFWAGAHCYVIEKCEKCLNYTYLYHFIKMHQKTFMQCQYGAGIPSLSLKSINAISIPLPPLSIQNEIVHILDSFTLLTAELTAELTARQKQYAFYRDYLLDFSNEDVTKKIPDIDCSNVEYKRLRDISNIIRGGNFQKKDFIEQGKPCIHYGQIYTRLGTTTSKSITYLNDDVYSKSKKAMPNDIIMAVTSENIEDVCKCTVWVGNKDVAVSGHTAIIHPSINSKYLAYYFQTTMFFKQKRKLAHGTKVIEVTPDKLNDIIIPVPPLSVQENIVKILDRFDKLNNDMSEGLPAEIKVRKKQYEYYRDTLLSFDDKACSQIVKVERERANTH